MATTEKQKLKQEIIATLVVAFMVVMIFGSIRVDMTSAANQTNTNLLQNFTAGGLTLEADATIAYTDLSVGVPANSTQNLTQVNIRDDRGTGAGWAVTGLMNDLFNATAETGGRRNNIRNTSIAWFPGNATLYNISGSTGGIAIGSNSFFSSSGLTLINTSTNNGMGNYRLNLTPINIQYDGAGNQIPGNYQTWLRLTIS